MSNPFRSSLLLAVLLTPASLCAAEPSTNPAPGEAVMRPTHRSLRLTWPIARYMSQALMQEMLWQNLGVSEDQQARISEAAAGRMMKLARERGAEMQPMVERCLEIMILTDGAQHCPPELVGELAQKTVPVARAFRDWVDGIPADSRGVLKPEQQKRVEARVQRWDAAVSEFERRMQRFKDGQLKPGESPFDNLEVEGEIKEEPDVRVSPELDNARAGVNRDLHSEKKMSRAMFLAAAAELFKFDEDQQRRGEALLEECGKRIQAKMTPEWKARVQRNRLLWNLQFSVGDVPRGPWMHRLEREYNAASGFIDELSEAFYADVLRLPTPEQWGMVHEEMRQMIEQYGFAPADVEGLIQRFGPPAASQPEGVSSQ